MLSAVLRSDTVIDVSVRIMDAFVEMRHFLTDNSELLAQVRNFDRRLESLERSTDDRFLPERNGGIPGWSLTRGGGAHYEMTERGRRGMGE